MEIDLVGSLESIREENDDDFKRNINTGSVSGICYSRSENMGCGQSILSKCERENEQSRRAIEAKKHRQNPI